MSQSEEPSLPGAWPDILAAYADGELDCDDRAAVEHRLAADPRAREELRAQRKLSPENWRLWQRVEPPLPDEEAWAATEASIAGALWDTPKSHPDRNRQAGRKQIAFFFAAGLAAAASLLLTLGFVERWVPDPKGQTQAGIVAAEAEDPLAGIETLVVARDEEVVIDRVAGDAGGWLLVGQPPVPGPIILASAEEVSLEGVEEHPAWPAGRPQLRDRPGDAPMIFAADPR